VSNIICVGDGGLEVQTEIGVVRGVHFRRRDGRRVGFVAGGGSDAEVAVVAQGAGSEDPDAHVALTARRHDGSAQTGILCVTEDQSVIVQGLRLAFDGGGVIDLGEVVEPAGPENGVRLFVRRSAKGRLQLCVAFPSVPAIVLASE
jgi:hypothetical protein